MREGIIIDGIRYDRVGDDLIPEWVTDDEWVTTGAFNLHIDDNPIYEAEVRLRRRTESIKFNRLKGTIKDA